MTATNALYVRLPHPEFDKLDRAAAALSTNKKAIVTTLVSHYVDPDTAHGLDHLRATLAAASPAAPHTPGSDAHPDAPSRRMTINLLAFTPSPPPEVLTAGQAAELLQVPEPELLALAKAGSLPGRRIGERWRFSRAALIEWLSS